MTNSPTLTYIPLPRFLLDDDELSNDAKLLYALLLDRASISKLNGFVDEDVRFEYISPSNRRRKSCTEADNAQQKFFGSWRTGLICRKKQGLDKPAIITLNYPASAKLIEPQNTV